MTVQNIPSITLPSRQFPGLLCFGAGFFNLIVPFGLSFDSFFGATLIVDSSSLGADKKLVGLFIRKNWGQYTFAIANSHNCVRVMDTMLLVEILMELLGS